LDNDAWIALLVGLSLGFMIGFPIGFKLGFETAKETQPKPQSASVVYTRDEQGRITGIHFTPTS